MGPAGRLGCAVLAVAVLAACKAGERGRVDSSRLAPELLTIHTVRREVAGPSEDGRTSACLVIGPPEIDARDLRTVVLQEATSEGVLDIVVALNARGTQRFTNVAGRSLGRPLAIVSEGKLLAAPRVESALTEGVFHISSIPRDRAIEIVRRVGGDDTVPKPTGPAELRPAEWSDARRRRQGRGAAALMGTRVGSRRQVRRGGGPCAPRAARRLAGQMPSVVPVRSWRCRRAVPLGKLPPSTAIEYSEKIHQVARHIHAERAYSGGERRVIPSSVLLQTTRSSFFL